jgi:xylan 1,4-beta-xylosidase
MSFRNPIISGFHPDPSICRAGDDYFLVNSSFEFFPGVPLFHSRDLVHWRQIGYCLTRQSQLPLDNVRPSGGIFAPTIRYHDGIFYMITTNISGGGNFYVTTDDPFGEWSEPIWVAQDGIDPSLFFDDDGKVYLTTTGYSSDPNDQTKRLHGILQSEIDTSNGRLLCEPRLIWGGTGGSYPEGPHLYKIGGVYYLMIAEGGTEYGHMETIARSDSPWGPWESCPHNPILSHRSTSNPIQAVGHADLVEAADGSWWAVCLGIRPAGLLRVHHLGRETFLAPVRWDSSGWPHIGEGGRISLEMEAPRLTPVVWEPSAERNEFDGPQLTQQWNFIGYPDPARWSLTQRPGWLALLGSADRLDDGPGVVFVGRRQEHFNCEVATALDYDPALDGEEAGLTVWMNPRHHYDLAVTSGDGARRIRVRARLGNLVAVVAQDLLPEGLVTLLVRADRYTYEFAIRPQGGDERVLATLEARYLATEVAGGFTGVYFGLYASGNGQGNTTAACFDWFDYRSREIQGGFGVETILRDLLADPAARAVVEHHLPGFSQGEIPGFMANLPLLDLGIMAPDQFPSGTLRAIAADLRRVSG